jgi:hypothetical protein
MMKELTFKAVMIVKFNHSTNQRKSYIAYARLLKEILGAQRDISYASPRDHRL